MPRRLTREETIKKFRQVWGDRYDYSLITDENYVNTSTHVPIVCRKHGAWNQTPYDHYNGAGCPHCWEERRSKSIRVTKEQFIERANAIHKGKYDYSLVEFETTSDRIKIICSKHGVFEQCVWHHLSGQGCKDCGTERRSIARTGRALKGARRTKFGIANLDVDFSTKNDPIIEKAYRHWTNMLQRCYDEKHRCKYLAYKDCFVCEEWLNFSGFLNWFLNTENSTKENYHLDKDILVKGNKIYSPETCCFVPAEINSLFTKRKSCRGILPIGVKRASKSKNYEACISKGNRINVYIGTFSTPQEAFNAYKTEKEKWVREQANKFFNDGKIARNVYEALLNYKVEIID